MHTASSKSEDVYSVGPSLCNWFGCSLFGGFRLTEWTQEVRSGDVHSPLLDNTGIPKAFCLPNLEFRLANNRRVLLGKAFYQPERPVHRAIISYLHATEEWQQWQKTDVRQQHKEPSPVFYETLVLRIFKQFIYFLGWDATKIPLASYRAKSGEIRLINATDITDAMRTMAAAVYDLNS